MQNNLELGTINKAFESQPLGTSNLTLKNRFIKSATYEGMYDNKGIPTEKLTGHHVKISQGGVGMTTVSYGAVSQEARTFADQMYIHEESLNVLKKMAAEIHKVKGRVSMQLTHCGYFSKNKHVKRLLAPSNLFNAYGFLSGLGFAKQMSKKDLEKVATDFERSAVSLKEIGFDAVEIHMGHGYLLSQFLSPLTNKRTDEYGGDIANRSRFPLEVAKKIVKAVGPDFPVLVKLNLDDGLKGGFSVEDCIHVCKKLDGIGCAAVVLSGGFTSKTPFYLMRGKVPLMGMIQNATSWAEKLTMLLFGPLIIKKYNFSANFFLDKAKKVRASTTLPLAYLGGVDSKRGIEQIVSAGFDFIALARPLIHDPQFLNKISKGEIENSGCNRCNQCIVEMDRDGVKCVLNT